MKNVQFLFSFFKSVQAYIPLVSKQFREPVAKKPEVGENLNDISNSISGGDFRRPSDYRRMSLLMQRGSKSSKAESQKSGGDVVTDKTVTKDDLLNDINTLIEIILW